MAKPQQFSVFYYLFFMKSHHIIFLSSILPAASLLSNSPHNPPSFFLLITLNSLAQAFSLASLCTWQGSGSAKLLSLLFHKALTTGGAFISFTIGLPTNPNFWHDLITIPTVPSILIGWTHSSLQNSSAW